MICKSLRTLIAGRQLPSTFVGQGLYMHHPGVLILHLTVQLKDFSLVQTSGLDVCIRFWQLGPCSQATLGQSFDDFLKRC